MQPKVKSNKLIVVDLETTCSNDKAEQLSNEIIEIGICIIDLMKLQIEKTLSLLVKPQRSQINEFCTKLTTITPKDVEDGFLLPEACNYLINEYKTKDYIWGSWGDFDRYMINRECRNYKTVVPFNRQHFNLKAFFALAYKLPELLSLDPAIKYMETPRLGIPHRGVDDARMTAHLFMQIMEHQMGVFEI